MTLRRGFKIGKGERVLVVEDVITTGKSTKEVIDVVKSYDGKVKAAVSLIDRSESKIDFGVPQVSLVKLDIKTYQPDSCPLCKQGSPAIKPGSRK